MRSCALLFSLFLSTFPLLAQSTTGELRLTVTDPAGLGVKSTVDVVSQGNEYRQAFTTDVQGKLDVKRLPYGVYQIRVGAKSFATLSEGVDIRSAVPLDRAVQLKPASVAQSVSVTDAETLIDPYRAGSVNEVGTQQIENRVTSLPGRGLQDLVNSQPGWLYEGNAVLHPRGSEYQTQFVVDGIPLTDNRSPSFGPEGADPDDIQSLKIYTAGIPAEYGRKMGGVIEVNTLRSQASGLHGQLTMFGGTYDTASGSTQDQYTRGRNTFGVSASGDRTNHYLNPVVPENYTNGGTVGSFSGSYERDLTEKDRLTLIYRHELARYQIPNELVQQNGALIPNSDNDTGCPDDAQPPDCVYIPGGQLQTAGNFEDMGSASYQHVFSADAVGWLRFMARHNSNDFNSNPASWPLIATQHNEFSEVYFNGSASVHRGRHEIKSGFEVDSVFLHENTGYVMPYCENVDNPQCPIAIGIFDPGFTSFSFAATRPDLEQSAYLEDLIRLGNWTVNAGLRWDHYQLLVNQNAVEPRIAASRYFPKLGMNVHGSFDRVFQTPSFENILFSSSQAAANLDTSGPAVQLPVEPSHGNYYELGATQGLFSKMRVDVNAFRRDVNNFADDDQILSTAISFPIAFRKAIIYGAEAKLETPHWGPFSGYASYSYMVGNAWYPVTGGLFLGSDASDALTQTTGHFPDSQDQRNSVRARVNYQVARRLWMAVGAEYNTGLPFQANLTPQQYATEYGQAVISHLNFDRGRIDPNFTQSVTVGADLLKTDRFTTRFQGDVANIGNTLELIDFGGLFSGNAIGPGRQFTFRLVTSF